MIEEIQLVNRWAVLKDFNPLSSPQVKDYCGFKHYKIPKDKKTKKPTTGKDGLAQLIRQHPGETVLPLVLESRHLRKAQGYLADERLGADGKFHPTYTFAPDTGRLASINPNFQNQPKHGVDEELAIAIRETIIPTEGMVLAEFDWKAIEAVLTGWFAGDEGFIKLSLMDSHSYLAWYILWEMRDAWGVGKQTFLYEEGKVVGQYQWPGLPEPATLEDPDLDAKLKWFKKEWGGWVPPIPGNTQGIRDLAKKVNHAGSYGMGPKHLADLLKVTLTIAIKFMVIKAKSAPLVARWQDQVRRLAHSQGYLENPFGYRRAFWGVYERKKDGTFGICEEANKALAFLPQSTAAGMLREALIQLADLPGEGETFHLLVPIHDAVLIEVKRERLEIVARQVKAVMQQKWKQLNDLSIEVDVKWGESWAEMKDLKL